MAITLGGNSSAAWSETFSYSCLTGNTSTAGSGTGILIYVGSMTKTYQYEVDSVEIILNSSSASVSSISGKTVSYRVTSGISNTKVMFSAKVTFKAISPTSAITNVIRKNPNTGETSSINYIKRKSTGTYFWTRPTTIALQLPWNYFKSWELKRTDGLNPSSSADVIANNTTLATSGTETYDISGIYFGDRLEFNYTLKPGGSVDVYNGERLTVDPDFSIKNTAASKGEMPEPTLALSSQWDFGEGTWSTVKNTSTRANFTLKVTKPDAMKSLKVNIAVHLYNAEAYYRENLNLVTKTDTSAEVYSGNTKITSTTKSYTDIGSIEADTASKDFTLKVVADSGGYHWPKYVDLYVKMTVADSSAHCYKTEFKLGYSSKGTYTSTSSGGGGYSGGFTGGYGGWWPS